MLAYAKYPLIILSIIALFTGWYYSYSVYIDDKYTAPMITDEETADPTAFGMQQGLIIAAAASAFLVLLTRRPDYRLAAAGVAILTALTYVPVWHSIDRLGISDWDYTMTNHNAWRGMILEQKTWPWWNPYLCGGSAGWADPEFTAISPYFLLELAFGTDTGLRLGAIISAAVLGLGILMLTRSLKLSPLAAFAASLIMPLSSVFALRIAEGHVPIFLSLSYFPWVLWAWHKAYTRKPQIPNHKNQTNHKSQTNKRSRVWNSIFIIWNLEFGIWNLLTGFLLALMFYQGGIYLLMYLALIFALLFLITKHKLHAFKITAISGLVALGLSAVKLIPMLAWLRHFQDSAYASSAFTLPHLREIFIGRFLHGAQVFPQQGSGWHEYGAFIGASVLLLAALSLLHQRRRKILQLTAGVILLVLLSSSGPYLKPFFDQAAWLPRSNVSRLIIPAVLGISLLAGFGIDSLKKLKYKNLIVIPLATIAVAELATLSYPIAEQAFVLPQTIPIPPKASANHILYSNDTFEFRHRGSDFTRAWSAAQQGYGTMSYCSVTGPKPAVHTVQHKKRPFAFFDSGAGEAHVKSWSPNNITITASHDSGERSLLLNMNYAPGWQAQITSDSLITEWQPVANAQGMAALSLAPGSNTVTFRYRQRGLLSGAIITAATILLLLSYLGKTLKWRKPGQASSADETSPSSR